VPDRTLVFSIFRYDPTDPESVPHMQSFELHEEPGLNLFVALNRIRETQDPSLQFDFVCRSAVCGSCGMLVNGRPSLACRTLTRDLPDRITLLPLPAFKLIGDLSVDTGTWFRGMNERVAAWIHEREPFDPAAPERRMSNETALKIYEAERCIECGCCVAGCATAAMRPAFLSPAGLNRVARFLLDPRDTREADDWMDIVATSDGVFGCLGLLACHDVCPKGLPLKETLAYLRRRLAEAAFTRGGAR
jgi:fumarate reductase iron-sulfur subunit